MRGMSRRYFSDDVGSPIHSVDLIILFGCANFKRVDTMKRGVIVLIWSCLLRGALFPQVNNRGIPFITHFPLTAYNAAMQNWAAVQDERGVMFFGNNEGILEYDGISWRLHRVTNKSIVRSLALDGKGRIYVGANSELGFLEPDSVGALHYVSLKDKIPEGFRDFTDVWRTYVSSEGVIFQTFTRIFLLKEGRISVLSGEGPFFFSYLINGRFYVKRSGKGLFALEDGVLKTIPESDLFADENFFAALPYGEEKILLAFRNKGLFLLHLNGGAGPIFEKMAGVRPVDEFIKKYQLYCGGVAGDGLFALGTLQNGLLIINRKGEIVQHLNRDGGLQDDSVYTVFSDREKNLWLGLSNGIAYMEISSPFALLNHVIGVSGNGFGVYQGRAQTGDSKRDLYLATGKGIYRNDPFSLIPSFKPIPNVNNQTWTLRKIRGVLLAGHREGILEIDEKTGAAKPVVKNNHNVFKLLSVAGYPDHLLACTWDGFELLRYSRGRWQCLGMIEGFSQSCRFAEQGRDGSLWVCVEYRDTYRMNLAPDLRRVESIRSYNSKQGLPSDTGNRVYRLGEDVVFGTENGVYKYDENRDRFFPDEELNALLKRNAPLYPFVEDDFGTIWFQEGLEKGAIARQKDGGLRLEKTALNRIQKAKIEVAIYPLDKQNVLFGVADGYIHYNPEIRKNFDSSFCALIRKVECTKDDSPLFLGAEKGGSGAGSVGRPEGLVPGLPYEKNALRFGFAAPYYEGREETLYSCWLDGLDEGWSAWSATAQREYTNLREGKYTFFVKARNIYGKESAVASYRFSIRAPWYRTLPAYLAYGLFGIFFIAAIVKVYTLRLRWEKIRLEQLVARKTKELKEASLTDPLTGLRNRRFLYEVLQSDISAFLKFKKYVLEAKDRRTVALQEKAVFGVFIFDIDHFKSVNDTYGHEAGDRLLKQLAQILKSSVRDDDAVMRIGGEEFLIVLKKTQPEYIDVFARKIKDQIQGVEFDLSQGISIKRTCSIGYTAFPFFSLRPERLNFEQTVMMADLGLYYAKAHGRNLAVRISPSDVFPQEEEAVSKMTKSLEYALNRKLIVISSS